MAKYPIDSIKKLSKISSCDRCRYYAHSPYLVCAIHPFGVSKTCRDFETAELWQPESLNNYQGLGMEEYDWHPIFTGKCPDCDRHFSRFQLPPLQWQCLRCGWEDDTWLESVKPIYPAKIRI